MTVSIPGKTGGHKYIWAHFEDEDHVLWEPNEESENGGYLKLMGELVKIPKNGHLDRDDIRDAGSAYVDLSEKRIEYGGGHPAYSKEPKAFKELIEANTDFEFVMPE